MPVDHPVDMTKYKGYVRGEVVKVQANWDYDSHCGLVQSVMRACNGTRAYDVTIRTISGERYAMIFVPHDDYVPLYKGLQATFLLTKFWAVPYKRCREAGPYAGEESAACQTMGNYVDAIVSTHDILPFDTTQVP